MADAAIKQTFNRDGYVVLPNALSGSDLAPMMAECRDILRRRRERHGIVDVPPGEAGDFIHFLPEATA